MTTAPRKNLHIDSQKKKQKKNITLGFFSISLFLFFLCSSYLYLFLMEHLSFELSRLEYACLVLISLQLQDKDKKWVIENFLTFIQLCNLISKKEGKYQESI